MKTIRFVKAAHSFGEDEFGEESILTQDDVCQILDSKLQMLNSTVDRLERECREYRKRVEDLEQNRNWLWENIDIIKKFLVGDVEKAVGLMQDYAANSRNVLGGLDAARETSRRLDKFPDSFREIFGNVIKDCLTPKLEAFGRQIGSLESQIARVDKTREEMLHREMALASELDECRNLAQNRTEQVSWFGRIIAWFKRKDTMPVHSEVV